MKHPPVTLYDPFRIGTVSVKNRLVHSAIFEFGADHGQITPRILTLYRQLARGGSGLIITGMQGVTAGAGIAPAMVETTYEDYERDMRQIVDETHAAGSTLFVQLQHAGSRTAPLPGYDRIGVSALDLPNGLGCHEATPAELRGIAAAFGSAAKRCKRAGCDGVQIHAAHGFLIHTFLSPYFNHRTDAYGGAIANRARLLFEVYEAIRTAVGADYPVSVKLPFSDLVSPSLTPAESIWICRELERRGMDMIEVSSGVAMDGSNTSFTPFLPEGAPEGTFRTGAEQIAAAVRIPVVSVCGYRTPDFIEQTLNQTAITAVSLGRPLVREPDLPNRWKTDRTKAACLSCNRCYGSQNIISCPFSQPEAPHI